MKKAFKVLFVMVVVASVVVLALGFLLRYLISSEQIKRYVLPVVSERLHRDLEIGDVNISVLSGPGIRLSNVKLTDRAEDRVFVAADFAELRCRFLTLFSGQVIVDEIILDNPVINIVRTGDGKFNFSDLAGSAGTGGSKPRTRSMAGTSGNAGSDSSGASSSKRGEQGIVLTVSSIAIKDGTISFTDYAVGSKSPFRYRVGQINLEINDFSMDRPFRMSLSALLAKAPLEVSGEVDLVSGKTVAEVRLSNLDLTDFAPYFASSLPGNIEGLKAGCDLQVSYLGNRIVSDGLLTFGNVTFVSGNQHLLSGDNISLDYKINMDTAKKAVNILSATLAFNGVDCMAQGSVNEQMLDISITIPEHGVSDVMAALPEFVTRHAVEYSPEGSFSLFAKLHGRPDSGPGLLQKAEVVMNHIRILSEGKGGVPVDIDGSMEFDSGMVRSRNLVVTAGSKSRFMVDVKVDDVFAKTLRVRGDVTSPLVDVDEMTSYVDDSDDNKGNGKTPPGGKEDGQGARPEEPGPFKLPVVASGVIKLDKVKTRGLEVNDFLLKYRLADNRLHLEQYALFAGGSFRKISDIDLGVKGLAYSSDVEIKDVQASDLVAALVSPDYRNMLSGSMSIDGQLKGKGVLPDDIKRNVSAEGKWHISKGRLAGQGLVKGLSSFLGLKELEEIDFDDADGNIVIRNGDVIFRGVFSSSVLTMKPQGTVSLSGPVDIALNAKIAPELVSEMKGSVRSVVKMLKDSDGWYLLPVRISGDYMHPSFVLDKKMVKHRVRQEAVKQIDRIISGKKGDETGGDTAESGEKGRRKGVIRNVIKGLFR
jgi:AsmA protein